MGHIRLGTLPRTLQWIEVFDRIGGGAGSPEVAAATMVASDSGLAGAAKDPGLVYSVWLLTQIPLAARSDDFAGRLQQLGLDVGASPSLLEVVGALAGGVDEHLSRKGGRTDLGEMAQMAACEALTALGTPATASLFEEMAPSAQETLRNDSKITCTSCLSFRPPSALQKGLHSATMRPFLRLVGRRKSGAICTNYF